MAPDTPEQLDLSAYITTTGDPCEADPSCPLANGHLDPCQLPDDPEELREQASALLARANEVQAKAPRSRVVPPT